MDWVVQSLNAVKGSAQGLSQLNISVPSFQNSEKQEFSSSNENYFSMTHFKLLCNDLLCLNPARDTNHLIETIRTITELLIWSDHNKARQNPGSSVEQEEPTTPDFFEYFLEHNLHVYMCWVLGLSTSTTAASSITRWGNSLIQGQPSSISLSGISDSSAPGSPNSPRGSLHSFNSSPVQQEADLNRDFSRSVNYDLIQLKIQVLQSLNILFESIRTPQVFYYLLSNNFINRLVTRPRIDVQSHEELVPYYVALLKALASKLAAHSDSLTPFFFNAQSRDLPLYVEAIRYHNHPDAMVRVAIRTLTLNIYSVDHVGLSRVVVDPSNQHYLLFMLKSLAQLPLRMEKALGLQSTKFTVARTELDASEFRSRLAEFLEQLDYLNDILQLGCTPLRAFIRPKAFEIVIEPIILNSYTPDAESAEELLAHRPPRSSLHLLLINHIFRSIDDAPLINLALQRLFNLDVSLLSGPPLPRLLSQVPPLLNVDISESPQAENLNKESNQDDVAEEKEELVFFGSYSRNSSALTKTSCDNVFSGFSTIWDVLDAQLRQLPSSQRPSPRKSFSTNSYQPKEPGMSEYEPHACTESRILLLTILASNLCKKTELRQEWLMSIGLCPVRQVRSWFILDSLTSGPDSQEKDRVLEKEKDTMLEWLNHGENSILSHSPSPPAPEPLELSQQSLSSSRGSKRIDEHEAPSLCKKIPQQVWYQHQGPPTLLRILIKNSRLHFVTLRLAANLLLDLVYFPGTESCLNASLARRLEILIHDISSRLKQYLTHPNCPLTLLLFEFGQFQNSVDQLPQRLVGLDALSFFNSSTDTLHELGSPLAQVSRTAQMFLLFHRLSHWILRTDAAIVTWWKNIKTYFEDYPIALDTTVDLESFHTIPVSITCDPQLKSSVSSETVLLFKDSQTQFILATIERKTFSKKKRALIVQVFPLIESEILDVPGEPHQLRIVKKAYFSPDRGLAKYPGAHSFPIYRETWSATLRFNDYVDSCQAAQNLRSAREACLSSGRLKFADILGLPFGPSADSKASHHPLSTVSP